VVIFAPYAPAMQNTDQYNHAVSESLCAPDLDAEFSQESMPFALDDRQLEQVRIELLERGFNPGFNPERNIANDTQLLKAIEQFQSENNLPVTGQIDTSTLAALSIPIEKSSPNISEELMRAKPSK
jgi:peptidoglycan hydrolase-like protein with peptidoglycan-binding domain